MSRPARRDGFSLADTCLQSELTMTHGIILPDELKRIPGLFRRWELPEVLEPHKSYHIEEAGCDAEGTPLLALYGDVASAAAPGEHLFQDTRSLTEDELAERWHLSPRTLQRWRCEKSGPAFFRLGNRRVRYHLADILSYERSRRAAMLSPLLRSGE
jgi:hypothetical protein